IVIIGQYQPRQEPSHVQIDDERALSWLRNGAQPTESVQKLLTATGVWAQFESERGGAVNTKLARRRLGATEPPADEAAATDEAVAEAAEAVAAEEAGENTDA